MALVESCPIPTVRPDDYTLLINRVGSGLGYLRSDNIEKLIKVSIEAEYLNCYPNLTKLQLEKLIKENIGTEPKTIKKYVECIKLFIQSKTNQKVISYYSWNIAGLYDSLVLERDRIKRCSVLSYQARQEKYNKRQRCKSCRKYLKDGKCLCK